MKVLRIRAIPISRGPVMAKPGAAASSPGAPPGGGGGGGGGGGDDPTDDPTPSGSAELPEDAPADLPADVDVIGAGTFAGVPLWQWIAIGAAFFWTRRKA